MKPMHTRRCGAIRQADASVAWRVWAPLADAVDLVLVDGDHHRPVAMGKEPGGYFSVSQRDISSGQRYLLRLNGRDNRPDPCSLWQPDGVTGPSAVVFPDEFRWTDANWKGIERRDMVFYELHVGTFTAEGSFEAIIPRLAALKELGITAIEIMPIAQFPGGRNWGYDGVLPYAAQNTYGGPRGFQKLIDSAHAAGLAVILDVVYNHFGPEGNYLNDFGPYFTDHYKTPWGRAINFDGPGSDPVRDFVLDNVRMWIKEFHLDGLRLDAVHAIYDLGARHILRAIVDVAQSEAQQAARPIHIIAESDQNDPRIVLPPERGGHGVHAQWSDDFHHVVHTLLTGECRGYYQDYTDPTQLAKAMETPFVYAGDYSPGRGRKHGAAPTGIPGDQFVVCIQNHDQVGNRARGDRLTELLDSPAKNRLAASLLLLSPHLPLIFMGEEYAEARPFPFFCSFEGRELIEAVRQGRRREFAHFVNDPAEVPDPASEATFESARLTWQWPDGTIHGGLRRLYQTLLTARRRWPALRDFDHRSARILPTTGGDILELIRCDQSSPGDHTIRALFNLSPKPVNIPDELRRNQAALFCSELTKYCGDRQPGEPVESALPYECVVFGPARWPSALEGTL